MHDWVQKLLALRRQYPALQDGTMQMLTAEKDELAFLRVLGGRQERRSSRILVVVNRSAQPATVRLQMDGTALQGAKQAKTLLGDAQGQFENNELRVQMPAVSAWIAAVE